MLAVALLVSTNGCKKDETPNGSTPPQITVFTNQTGEPNATANGLQAEVIDSDAGTTVDFYGTFNADGSPKDVSSIRVARTASDTVVNFILDPVTKNFDRAVFEVNGERLNLLVTFDFPAGDTSMILNHYNYNWSTGESDLYYSGECYLSMGNAGAGSVYVAQKQAQSDGFVDGLVSLGIGVGVAEVAVATGAIVGTSIVGTAVGAVAAAVTAVSVTTVVAVAAVGATIAAMSSANASELDPQNVPVPNNTPNNNTTNQVEPNPALPQNPCLTNRVSVTVGVDPGNTLVALAQGGTYGPYEFFWSTGQTGTGNTYNSIQVSDEGTYAVTAVDSNGCAGTGYATIGDMTVVDKLVQWGPWQTDLLDSASYYVVIEFSTTGQCICYANSIYDDSDHDGNFVLWDSGQNCNGTMIENGYTIGFYDSCPWTGDPALAEDAKLHILTLTENSLIISDAEDTYYCTPQ